MSRSMKLILVLIAFAYTGFIAGPVYLMVELPSAHDLRSIPEVYKWSWLASAYMSVGLCLLLVWLDKRETRRRLLAAYR